ncbi:MAG: hypothetical protein RI911_19 [Candidatus Parcubacteria bacterium]|jgi:uncharacterized protein YggE
METLFSQPIIQKVSIAALVCLGLLLGAKAITEIKGWKFIGSGTTATNTIAVTGKGEIFAVPDIAQFTLGVTKEAKDVKAAQKEATQKMNDIIAYLKSTGIEERDIKTINYTAQPKYEWIQLPCRPGEYCGNGQNKLVAFVVAQTIQVKVRKDTDKASDVLGEAGARGATEIGSLEFINDDEDKIKAEARNKAIADAKQKADALARELGVKIVRVVGFSEDGGAQPIMYRAAKMEMAMMADAGGAAPELPVGENKIQSNVTVTYEIR